MSDLAPDAITVQAAMVDGQTVVRVTGEVDLATADVLERALDDAFDRGAPVIIDLRATTFIGSAALASIVRAQHRPAGVAEVQVLLQEPIQRLLFEATGLDALVARDD